MRISNEIRNEKYTEIIIKIERLMTVMLSRMKLDVSFDNPKAEIFYEIFTKYTDDNIVRDFKIRVIDRAKKIEHDCNPNNLKICEWLDKDLFMFLLEQCKISQPEFFNLYYFHEVLSVIITGKVPDIEVKISDMDKFIETFMKYTNEIYEKMVLKKTLTFD